MGILASGLTPTVHRMGLRERTIQIA